MIPFSAGSILHEIAVNVVHSDHGDFLKTFADAYLRADQENEKIMRQTWFLLINKYGLDKECEHCLLSPLGVAEASPAPDQDQHLHTPPKSGEKPEFFKKEPVEELVGVATMEEYVQIEEIKGSCPKCGGPLEFKEHVHIFNEDGSPSSEDTYRDPYCPSCKLFWLGQEASE